ncbi:hypothetical protein BH09ACT4_BH09ACT4_07770 [soil metagenome]
MNTEVVYESEFGATRLIAEAIAEGIGSSARVTDVRVPRPAPDGSLLVVGAPTHARSMPTAATRHEAQSWPDRAGSRRHLEPGSTRPGVREWLAHTRLDGVEAIAFTTRASMSRLLSGSATVAIARGLRFAGAQIAGQAEEFLVTADGSLVTGELARARAWGATISAAAPE